MSRHPSSQSLFHPRAKRRFSIACQSGAGGGSKTSRGRRFGHLIRMVDKIAALDPAARAVPTPAPPNGWAKLTVPGPSGRIPRPFAGLIPSTRKKFSDMRNPCTSLGSAPPDSYSVIGVTDPEGRPAGVTPDADRTIRSGSGLY